MVLQTFWTQRNSRNHPAISWHNSPWILVLKTNPHGNFKNFHEKKKHLFFLRNLIFNHYYWCSVSILKFCLFLIPPRNVSMQKHFRNFSSSSHGMVFCCISLGITCWWCLSSTSRLMILFLIFWFNINPTIYCAHNY